MKLSNRFALLQPADLPEEEAAAVWPTPAEVPKSHTPKKTRVEYKGTPGSCVKGTLCPIRTIEPARLCPVAEKLPEWEVLDFMVDSGASETVMPEEAVRSIPTMSNEPPRCHVRGREWPAHLEPR